MAGDIGYRFQPGRGDLAIGQATPKPLAGSNIKTLNLRLPKRAMVGSIAPRSLLESPGSAGAGAPSLLNSIAAALQAPQPQAASSIVPPDVAQAGPPPLPIQSPVSALSVDPALSGALTPLAAEPGPGPQAGPQAIEPLIAAIQSMPESPFAAPEPRQPTVTGGGSGGGISRSVGGPTPPRIIPGFEAPPAPPPIVVPGGGGGGRVEVPGGDTGKLPMPAPLPIPTPMPLPPQAPPPFEVPLEIGPPPLEFDADVQNPFAQERFAVGTFRRNNARALTPLF